MLLDLARAEAVALTLPDGTRLPASPELPLPAAGAEGNGLVTVTFRLLSQPTGLTDGTLAEVGLSLPVPQILLPRAGALSRHRRIPGPEGNRNDKSIDFSPGAVRRNGIAAVADVAG